VLWVGLAGCAHAQTPPTPVVSAPESILVFQALEPSAEPTPRCLAGFRVRQNPVYTRYRLLVLTSVGDAAADVATISNCLGSAWARAPVEVKGNSWMVSTSQLLVSFEPSIGLAEARAILARNGLAMKDDGLFDRARTVTADSGRAPTETVSVAAALATVSGVRHAEPSLVTIAQRP